MENPAVEYLESCMYPGFPKGYIRSFGVSAVRPMIELIEDHETYSDIGRCYICNPPNEG